MVDDNGVRGITPGDPGDTVEFPELGKHHGFTILAPGDNGFVALPLRVVEEVGHQVEVEMAVEVKVTERGSVPGTDQIKAEFFSHTR